MSDTNVEARNVSMYPAQWAVVDTVAKQIARLFGGKVNTSLGLRQIVQEYQEIKGLEVHTPTALVDSPEPYESAAEPA